MSIKFVTLTMHDGKTSISVNPLRVNYLVSLDAHFTKIHFGLDQTVDVTGDLGTVENCLSNLEPVI